VPSVGARAFCLLLGFSKVSRCKSGTLSGRYRSNGYVLMTNCKKTLPIRIKHQANNEIQEY
ncbi:hypothetical protein, partial [Pseudomonas pergaminensis]|uniref:hypothetical protein n=1 Tax=Pseudomonas pergaminensis TaxID=2853159 RepID=UPI0034D51B42